MDEKTREILKAHGYDVSDDFRKIKTDPKKVKPKVTFYFRDGGSGEIREIQCRGDRYNLEHYLGRGFVLDKAELEPPPKVKKVKLPPSS